jgi:hypothetical protein
VILPPGISRKVDPSLVNIDVAGAVWPIELWHSNSIGGYFLSILC